MNEFFLQALVTLLVIINPFAVVPIFVSLTQDDSFAVKKKIAKKACLISIILLLSFAFAGDKLLDLMRISPEAFRITGGFLLLLAAIDMVLSKGGSTKSSGNGSGGMDKRDDISVYPLAIPLLAGPGALTSTVLLMREAHNIHLSAEISVIAVVILVMIITLTSLLLGDRLMKILGVTGTNVLTRVCGIILSAVSIDNIIKGVVAVIKLAKV
jgi:multiple antibiotic resistance protein